MPRQVSAYALAEELTYPEHDVNSAEEVRSPRLDKPALLSRLSSPAVFPRLCVYAACTLVAVWISYLLGKDMNWDTLDYHFYAGFSALHDRFGRDYFPAGSQSYFNPYIYVPFYLLASSRLPALVDATVLAFVQSGILWLTYEIAIAVAPSNGQTRISIAIGSVLLALANPILINQFGSSYADTLTAEVVLAGWLLLIMAVRVPSARYVTLAGLFLGSASALKLTNGAHALCAGVLILFIPVHWRARMVHMVRFGAALAIGLVLVSLPWSIRLEHHFGNPLFPLLNEIFRSPQFPTAPMLDYRFIPDSIQAALWRPFAIVKPLFMVDDELAAPDLRYAVLLTAAVLLVVGWIWRRRKGSRSARPASASSAGSQRALAALGCGFLADWVLWLTASGNGRYFIAMACIAGILAIAMIHRLCTSSKVRAYTLAALFGVQLIQLLVGAGYRNHIAWNGAPWFEVRIPPGLPNTPALYLSYGVQSNAFIVPFLPLGSGFINIAGDYPLAPDGANGAMVKSLIQRYSPNLRVVAREVRAADKRLPVVSGIAAATDALQPFGLAPVTSDCVTIVIPGEGPQDMIFVHTTFTGSSAASRSIPDRKVPAADTGYLVTCPVVAHPVPPGGPTAGEQRANMVFDRLEKACPALFQPARPLTQYFGDASRNNEIWSRRYLNTNLTAWVSRGWVQFIDPLRGGPASYIGPETAFERKQLRIDCGRRDERYFAKVVPSARGGS